jgi:hypothetical protein
VLHTGEPSYQPMSEMAGPEVKKVVPPRAPRRRARPPMGGCATVEWLLGGALHCARLATT